MDEAPNHAPGRTPAAAPDARGGHPGRSLAGRWFRRQFTVSLLALMAVVGIVAVTRPLDAPATSSGPAGPAASIYLIGGTGTGLGVGERAPEFGLAADPLVDLNGSAVTMAQLKGHPTWIVFWATWCPPCQQETPDIRSTWEQYRASGLVVLAIDVQEPAEVVRSYASTYGLTYRIGLDTTAATMKNYAVFGLPTHYFLDADGIIRDRWFGPLTATAMRQRVEAIGATK